jgi:phage portal protein BeeE
MTAAGNRNGAPPVVPPELTPTEMSFNPSDLALLETQQWNAMMIASAYGIPGPIVNMALTGGLTYQNPVALMQMWWLTELSTTSKRIMDAFTAQMLPRGQSVSQDATDMTIEGSLESDDDPQLSQAAAASPVQSGGRLSAIGGGA